MMTRFSPNSGPLSWFGRNRANVDEMGHALLSYFTSAAPASALTADNRVPAAGFSQVAGSSISFG
jgi:hypothetical protein